MKNVFADTSFYLALLNPNDQWFAAADRWLRSYPGRFVTTTWVLLELLNSAARGRLRGVAVRMCADIQRHRLIFVVPASQRWFAKGQELYAARVDKDWSLTDCISFQIMKQLRITEAATTDQHFTQAGFKMVLT